MPTTANYCNQQAEVVQAEKKLLEAAIANWVLGSKTHLTSSFFCTSIFSFRTNKEAQETTFKFLSCTAPAFLKFIVLLSYSSATNIAISDMVDGRFSHSLYMKRCCLLWLRVALTKTLFKAKAIYSDGFYVSTRGRSTVSDKAQAVLGFDY